MQSTFKSKSGFSYGLFLGDLGLYYAELTMDADYNAELTMDADYLKIRSKDCLIFMYIIILMGGKKGLTRDNTEILHQMA